MPPTKPIKMQLHLSFAFCIANLLLCVCSALVVEVGRKTFLTQSVASLLAVNAVPDSTSSQSVSIQQAFVATTIRWNDDNGPANWDQLRYGSSSLQSSRKVPAPSNTAAIVPSWLEGYWQADYKFSKVSFPQGKRSLNVRIAGVGQGTCLSLPNVGINPPAHIVKYLKGKGGCYEDLAYSLPRRWEAFLPQTRVTSVQAGSGELSPKCMVSGEGCLATENPKLHDPATRVSMQFTSGASMPQTIDTTMVDTASNPLEDGSFVSSRTYAQYSVDQDLRTYYREFVSFKESADDKNIVTGVLRVASFAPPDGKSSYDDGSALVISDYDIVLTKINEEDAQQA